MIIIPLLLTSVLAVVTAQTLVMQDLSNNHGYLPIKLEDIEIIDSYKTIIHIINTTQYLEIANHLQENIHRLTGTYTRDTLLLYSIRQNMETCKTKIKNLIPQFGQKLGKGLKVMVGTMSSEDERKILQNIHMLEESSHKTMTTIDESKISNITARINLHQNTSQKYINRVKPEIANRSLNLEDEIIFLENIFKINIDINLLTEHVNEIGHVIFNSKLGVIPTDILTTEEFSYIDKISSYLHTKVSLSYKGNLVILALKVPSFINDTFSKIIFEPIPDKQNKSLILKANKVLVHKEDVYKADTIEFNKLTPIEDECLTNIVKNLEPKCTMGVKTNQEEKEIFPGLIIFKNYQDKIVTNCKHSEKFENIKTYLLKFENCFVRTKVKTYENYNININEMYILEELILKMNANNTTYSNLNETLRIVYHKLVKNTIISTTICLSLTIILFSILSILYIKTKNKTHTIVSMDL